MPKGGMGNMTDMVKGAIKNSGLSLNALARETGVQVSSLSRFMRGEQDLVFGAVQNLARVLGLRMVQERPEGNSSGGGRKKERGK